MGQLFLWSAPRGGWAVCPPDEITWLDRSLLSGNQDLTLHRAPRCAGLRYVHRRWELFSRDTTNQVYLAPDVGQPRLSPEAVRREARQVLPPAAARYEALAVVLDEGSWLIGVGAWVLRLRLEASARPPDRPAGPDSRKQPPTLGADVLGQAPPARRGSPPRADAVGRVHGYLARNATARMAMAYYYQDFILDLPAPQTVPMIEVVIALNLSGEGAVSDHKKQLQGLIWSERGHARDLVGFLLAHGLLTRADLDQARQVAADNERSGACAMARQRLQYRPKETPKKR
jgi:hypothetical protein